MIELTDVVKRFHTGGAEIWAIDGVCLRVAKGALVAVTGASGSGKSTLLHLIGAIEKADAGTVVVGGTDLTAQRPSRLAEYRRRIGFVFQRYHLIPTPTALDNVVAPVLPLRTRFPKAQRAKELLAAVGLAGRDCAAGGGVPSGEGPPVPHNMSPARSRPRSGADQAKWPGAQQRGRYGDRHT